MTTNEPTIFTKIINREVPTRIVYEDEVVLAFLDNNPTNLGHTLIVPKQPFVNIFDGPPETMAHLMKIGQLIGQALVATPLATGINLIMNNGGDAGQEVFHAHLHVVPRLPDDHVFQKPTHVTATADEQASVAATLSSLLKQSSETPL